MKFTVQYIPLSKIKPNASEKVTDHLKKLQRLMWDCMFVIMVRKNRKDDNYTILSGQDRFESLRKHTKNLYAPCIVDKSTSSGFSAWWYRIRKKQPLDDFPLMPVSWSITRKFLKQERRFQDLNRIQQLKVLLLAARYKKTVVFQMKTLVNEFIKNNE